MKLHTGENKEKPFLCSHCGNAYSELKNLRKHLKGHTGEKPFSCLECAKSFALKATLKRHLKMHAGIKPHSCPECDRSFGTSHTLKVHMRTHTGERPFSCSQCEKTFSLKNTLKHHLQIHTGEKPYSCSLCPKTFVQNTHLRQHLKFHHTGWTVALERHPYSCMSCIYFDLQVSNEIKTWILNYLQIQSIVLKWSKADCDPLICVFLEWKCICNSSRLQPFLKVLSLGLAEKIEFLDWNNLLESPFDP